MSSESRFLWMFCGFAILLGGCSEPATPEGMQVYPVRGDVRYHGKPAVGVMVAFHPELGSGQQRSYAKTSADGSFALTTHELQDGAPVGAYRITLTWPPTEEEERPGLVDKLAGKYANPKNSKLAFEVKAEPNVVPTIDLQ